MKVYLDHCATTRCYPQVAEIVVHLMMEEFGNPSSMHQMGVEAEQYVREAQETIAATLKVKEKEILFTSGGTESNNLALMGTAMANKRAGKRIITTAVEHAAVSAPAAFLKEQGFEVIVLPVDSRGVVKLNALEEVLTEDTILVSTMYVNNEVGAVEPVEEIARLVHERAPKALYHVDAIQAYGKYVIHPKKIGIDLLSVSGHKIHGPKGVGFLYINEKAKVQPLILGGGQQNGMRSGTDNVPGIAGMGLAAGISYHHLEENVRHLYCLKERMTEGLEKMEGVTVNGMALREGAPHIVSATFQGIRSEVLLHSLEERGIYISAGSACSSHKRAASATLTAMGLKKAAAESTVRFSFSEETTEEEITYCLQALQELVPMLRRYARR